jgi:hypothetical protein
MSSTTLQRANFQTISDSLDQVSDQYQNLNSSAQNVVEQYSRATADTIGQVNVLKNQALAQAGQIQTDLTDIKSRIGKLDLTGDSRKILVETAEGTSAATRTTVNFLNDSGNEARARLGVSSGADSASSTPSSAPNSSSTPANVLNGPGINLGIDQNLAEKLLLQQTRKPALVKFNYPSDYRARLVIPNKFSTELLKEFPSVQKNGIIFPYTPSIEYTQTASYSTKNLLHTNYTRYYYHNSSITPIRVEAKFTVQNRQEAAIFFSTMYVLKALTRMKTLDFTPDAVNSVQDINSLNGNTPPVCRFYAYGGMIFSNVPVVVSSCQLELPNDVNYYEYNYNTSYGTVFLPAKSTIVLELTVVYSKEELANFSLSDFIFGTSKNQGYL